MSDPERVFVFQLRAAGILDYHQEYMFAYPRKWRADFAFVEDRLLVEIEGGVWAQGRHTRGSGFVKDLEKYNQATILGWKLLRVTPAMIEDGTALALVEQALAQKEQAA
jgi:very-short-patch-repair endonuclease